jgi:hypothetical protein
MILVKADADSEAGKLPDEQMFVEMGKYNEELVKAGVLLTAEGLAPSSKGARIVFDSSGNTTVVDGPFAETKELIAGFWLIQVATFEEAVKWVRRVPMRDTELELRQVFTAEDFGDAVSPEIKEQDRGLREQTGQKQSARAGRHSQE